MSKTFEHGNHVCALYATPEEHFAIASAYVADGLRRGERCFYVGASPTVLAQFRAALSGVGIDANEMAKNGSLLEATHAEAHLLEGCFETERMLAVLNER